LLERRSDEKDADEFCNFRFYRRNVK